MVTINPSAAYRFNIPQQGCIIGRGSEGIVAAFPDTSKCVKIRNKNTDFGNGETLKGDRVAVKEYCMTKALEDMHASHLICKTDDVHIDAQHVITSMDRYDGDFSHIMPPISCCPIGICAPTPLAIAASQIRGNVTTQLEGLGVGVTGQDDDNKNWFFKEVDIYNSAPNTFTLGTNRDQKKYKVVRGDLSFSNTSNALAEQMKNKFNALKTSRPAEMRHMNANDMFRPFE